MFKQLIIQLNDFDFNKKSQVLENYVRLDYLRLQFSKGTVTDYYSRLELYNGRYTILLYTKLYCMLIRLYVKPSWMTVMSF